MHVQHEYLLRYHPDRQFGLQPRRLGQSVSQASHYRDIQTLRGEAIILALRSLLNSGSTFGMTLAHVSGPK